MADSDDPRSKSTTPNERKAVQAPSEPEAGARRTASAEGLSAIEDALLPMQAREPARTRENVTPLPLPVQKAPPLPVPKAVPRPVQKPLPRPKQEPLSRPKQEPLPRPKQEPRPTQKARTIQAPEQVEERAAARPVRSPEGPIHRSDYRPPRAQEPGFLGAVVAIVSMVAVLVGLAVAYLLLRR
jgi:hypothetical protein